MDDRPTLLDLFSGIGGFSIAFESVGFRTIGFSEIDENASAVLAMRFRHVPNFGDVRCFTHWPQLSVDVLCGGDPCPKHSRARSNGDSNSPDLAGYFLAVAGRYRPRWVVRENVPAPTVDHFAAALVALGYGTVVVRTDAAPLTGQTRQRDFVVGCYQATEPELRRRLPFCENGKGTYATKLGTRPVAPCLTTHRTRHDSRDCYIYDSRGLRILDAEEREQLAGFPRGWTHGFSEGTRAKLYGNSVVPAVARPFAAAIYQQLIPQPK